ncbi:hypothetical protein, partial [Burkholderia cenocepacia]|uniref:hypothetical protein n=1 Tax=Burkholderia cenocepacia TaxID=95486 RepID=UPI0011777ABE
MESKNLLYSVMQRVLNDLTCSNINDYSKQISFMEVAKTLAKVGNETVEPELLEMTSQLGTQHKAKFMVK